MLKFLPRLLIACGFMGLIAAYVFFPRTYVITVTAKGFDPQNITIHPGDSVTFKNADNAAVWPASDPHPSHVFYPVFDHLSQMPPGKEWTFTFRVSGDWTYHDHLHPDRNGKVQVRPRWLLLSKLTGMYTDNSESSACTMSDPDERKRCWLSYLSKYIEGQGIDKSYRWLMTAQQSDPTIFPLCHDLAHLIGKGAYRLFIQNKLTSLSSEYTGCDWGFYHGFMELFVSSGQDVRKAGMLCDSITAVEAARKGESVSGCYHGIGHGSAIVHEANAGQDLWQAVPDGIRYCEQASPNQPDRLNCVSGVIDGIASVYTSGTLAILPKTVADPYAVCVPFPHYADSCYSALNWYLLWIYENDFAKALNTVATIPSVSIRQDVTLWLSSVAVRTVSDARTLLPVCLKATAVQRHPCVNGIVQARYRQETNIGPEYAKALEVCDTFPESFMSDCTKEITRLIRTEGSPEGKKTLCALSRWREADVCTL